MHPMSKVKFKHWAWACLGAATLALVFRAYGRPDFLVDLSNALWACF